MTAENVFGLQDELAEQVATAVAGAYGVISLARFRDAARKPPDRISSYECVLKTHEYVRLLTPASHTVARDCLERVVEVDPQYADAWAWLAYLYVDEHAFGFNAKPLPFERANEAIRKAIDLDPSNSVVTTRHAYYLYHKKDPQFFDRAREAVAANPRDVLILGEMGFDLALAGQWEEGLAMVERAIELSPIDLWWWYVPFSMRAYLDGDYRSGLAFAQKVDLPGYFWYHTHLAYNYARLGQMEEARVQAASIRQSYPDYESNAYAEWRKWVWDEYEIEAVIAGLREAGLDIPPEGSE